MRLSRSLKLLLRASAALLLVCMTTGCLHTGKKPFAKFISKPQLDMTEVADTGPGWATGARASCGSGGFS